MPLTLKGSNSGGVTIDVPANAGNNTLTFPAATGTALVGTTTTANQIFFGGATSGTLSQSSNLVWDSANNQLDIGAGTQSLPALSTVGDNNTGIYFPAADTIGFVEGGVEAMRLDASGNLGLGVSPTSGWVSGAKVLAFDTSNNGGVSGNQSAIWNFANSIRVSNNAYFNGTNWVYTVTGQAPTSYFQVGGSHVWQTAASGTAPNTFTFTQAMTLDASGNLGIGETSPSTYGQLVVKGGTTSATSPILALVANSFLGSDGPALDFARAGFTQPVQARIRTEDDGTSSSNLSFWTKNTGTAGTLTKRMTLDNAGNLGIGETSPSTYGKLAVIGTGYFSGGLRVNGALSGSGTLIVGAATKATLASNAIYISTTDAGNRLNGFMSLETNPTASSRYFSIGCVEDGIAWRDIVIAGSGGNVGIGTTSPGAPLTINGTGATGGQIQIQRSGTLQGNIYGTGSAFRIENTSSTPIVFLQNTGTEYARIDSSGNLLVGTTTSWSRFAVQHAGATTFGISTVNSDTSGVGQTSIAFVRNGSYVGTINTTSSATSYNTSSDLSLKTTITDAASSLASILALPVRQFDWKNTDEHTDYGVVAQEAYDYAPEMVSQGDLWSVDYGRITPRLIKAFQELSTKLDAAEARIASLEGAN